MKQYRFALDRGEPRIPAGCAYALYAWLLSQLPAEVGDILHQQGETPLVQYLYYDYDRKETIWVISFLADWLSEEAAPVLSELSCIPLHSGSLNVQPRACREVPSAPALMEQAKQMADCRYTTFQLLSPMSFRQRGRYVLFPQERLFLQSLIVRWNLTFPQYSLDDADAFQALEDGLRIVDYRLHTVRYPIKNAKIPGFSGSVTLESRLSAPLEEIWKLLSLFSPYCGIGIKTTLGMGGVAMLSNPGPAACGQTLQPVRESP